MNETTYLSPMAELGVAWMMEDRRTINRADIVKYFSPDELEAYVVEFVGMDLAIKIYNTITLSESLDIQRETSEELNKSINDPSNFPSAELETQLYQSQGGFYTTNMRLVRTRMWRKRLLH